MPWPRQIRRRIHSAVATQGTHDGRRFITPEELAEALARYGVSVEEQVGVGFNPFLSRFRITAHLGGSAPGSIPPPAGTGRPGGRR
jgi:hypothetical protein